MSRNFDVGDVVVCVRMGPCDGPWIRIGGLYNVSEAWISRENCPAITLAEVPPIYDPLEPDAPFDGFASEGFRLAYKPDPEVAREAQTNLPTRKKEPAR